MFYCNPEWKDLKIGEVMRLLEQSGVHHANPNELKRRIQGFLKRLKQTAARSDEGIDEGVNSKSWGRGCSEKVRNVQKDNFNVEKHIDSF